MLGLVASGGGMQVTLLALDAKRSSVEMGQ